MKQQPVLVFSLLILFHFGAFCQNKNVLYEGPPVFHGAQIVGNYPNTPFLFTVPATGARPITFTAKNLPAGLLLDPSTGIITGSVSSPGEYKLKVTVTNAKGNSEEDLKIVIGETLCLTPAMGWNSWNVFTKTLNEKMVMDMADAMVSTGMRDLGYQYINMDDFWHADTRDSIGRPVPDAKKFPHGMKYLSNYVHSKGLKLGIYSCAGNMTCGRRFGGYTYEEIDAKTYAEWGIDLLKYDYCYTPPTTKTAVERYSKMGTALKHSGRSIVFSICEWGFRHPWKWGQQVGGQYWRVSPDIMDSWKFPSIWVFSMKAILNREEKLWKYAGPGHWNDPDMLIVGNYGKGLATGGNGLYKGMTDVEYQTHFSLWCMFAAPLLASNDLRSMNEATAAILTNPEMLALDQDPLGEQAKPVYKMGCIRVYLKQLSDGSVAVAVLNTSAGEKKFDLRASMLDIQSVWRVRDLWKHEEAGAFKDKWALTVQPHQTIVLKLSR